MNFGQSSYLFQSFHTDSTGAAMSTDCWIGMRRPSPTPSCCSSESPFRDGLILFRTPASFAAPNIFFAERICLPDGTISLSFIVLPPYLTRSLRWPFFLRASPLTWSP